MIIRLIAGLIKRFSMILFVAIPLYKMSQYFPKPYEPCGGDINVKVDLSNYATKTIIKNSVHIDTSSSALRKNLASLKTEVDKLDIDKLVPLSYRNQSIDLLYKSMDWFLYDNSSRLERFN